MLSSITPLGQRGRGGSWTRTVVAFWVGAMLAGSVLFGGLGLLGEFFLPVPVGWWVVLVIGVAGALDLLKVPPWGPRRQVNEDWLREFRDWVVGLGFGAQLGLGIVTIVTTWSVWALVLIAPAVGLGTSILMGLTFGVGRSVLLVWTRPVNDSRVLGIVMARFARLEQSSKVVLATGYLVVLGLGWQLGPR